MSLKTDPVEVARAEIRVALAPYFKGKVMGEKLEEAVEVTLRRVQPLLRIEPVGAKKGATVMTEGAATKTDDGRFISRPRSM
jgi:hypothetical protein